MEPILEPGYWSERYRRAVVSREIHRAVFVTPLENWHAICRKHTEILARHVQEQTSILDVGCGYGRLLSMLPSNWIGDYLGIDICRDMVDDARGHNPNDTFAVHDVQHELPNSFQFADGSRFGISTFDLAVLISFRPMVIRNCGGETWDRMEANVRKVARKLLYLEYDPEAEGMLE